jgi:hypothetical protein
MQVITRGRQGGKTEEAARWVLADPDRLLLVMNAEEVSRLRREYHVPARQIMRAGAASERLLGRHPLILGVDNIDMLGWRTLLWLGQYAPYIELATETR